MIFRDVSVHRADGSLYDVTSCMVAWSHDPPRGVPVSGPMLFLDESLSGGPLSRGSLSHRLDSNSSTD